MMYGNLMPGSKMPQPQMFVVPKQLLAGLGNDKFRTERLRPQGTKTKFYLATELLILRWGRPESFVFLETQEKRPNKTWGR
jgi:hypothetical protein